MRDIMLFSLISMFSLCGCGGGGGGGSDSPAAQAASEDKECEEYLKEKLACEAKKWFGKSNAMLFKGDKAHTLKYIDKFYAAGAKAITASPSDLNGSEICDLFIIELPQDAEARKKVFAVEAEYYKEGGAPEDATKDHGQKYLKFNPE